MAIGGNGTCAGIKSLSKLLESDGTIQSFFIPVTIDSDIHGTECIGQHTAVEAGSEKIRGYVADAYTHQRAYLIEMMGADGGFHALHSCIGAGAHYAALKEPLPDEELRRVAMAITERRSTVVVVAEGYARSLRQQLQSELGSLTPTSSGRPEMAALSSASAFLHWQLQQTGCLGAKKVVCEPFSRDIRGAAPNNLDTFLSQVMARQVVRLSMAESAAGQIKPAMPSVLSGKVASIPFDDLVTDNTVDPETLSLADNL